MKAGAGSKRAKNYLRLFVIECPNPIDVMDDRSEATSVAAISKLIGHKTLVQTARSYHGLSEACQYITSICNIADVDLSIPLCLHIGAHGAPDGLQVGKQSVGWEELLTAIMPVFTKSYDGKRVLVLSACEANQQKLTDGMRAAAKKNKRAFTPPQYVFCASGSVGWPDAAVGWTLLYHLIPKIDLDKKGEVQDMLKKITAATNVNFPYFRWDADEKKYRSWGLPV